MVKKIAAFLLLLALLLPAFALADAQVLDRAGVLTSAAEESITEMINRIEREHQVDLIVLTTTDTPFDGTEDLYYVRNYADDFYDNGGYGMGPDDSGMLVLLDMHNRAVWLSTGGVMREFISDYREEVILDACYDDLRTGDYGRAMTTAVRMIGEYMDAGRAEGTFLYDEVTGERLSGIYNALTGGEMLLAGIAGLVAAAVVLISVNSSYSMKGSTYSYDVGANSDMDMTRDNEQYLRQSVHRTARSTGSGNVSGGGGSRSGGGGSGVHRSSGGVSHGGGGRRF